MLELGTYKPPKGFFNGIRILELRIPLANILPLGRPFYLNGLF